MNRFAAVVGLLAASATVGQAGMMPTPWSYSVRVASDRYRSENGYPEGDKPNVPARTPNGLSIAADFTTPVAPTAAVGDRAVVLATARLVVDGGDQFPGGVFGHFNSYPSGGYTVTVRVTDGPSGQFDDFAFRGLIDGPISFGHEGQTGSRVTNTIVGPTSHDFRIAGRVYAMDAVAFAPFGEPEVYAEGRLLRAGGPPSPLLANVRVSETPEPATAVLAALGLGLVALRRRQSRSNSSTLPRLLPITQRVPSGVNATHVNFGILKS